MRERFRAAGVFVVSLVSSPGAGKTAFLEKTLTRLRLQIASPRWSATWQPDDAVARLARSEVPVKQIITGTVCHLEAAMVENALDDWNLRNLDFLFIENVGNLVCPSSYDLGEELRLVLMSVTEGEDKPLKYPTIFNTADVAVITKTDIAEAVEFDLRKARESIQSVRPGMRIFELSAKTGDGMNEWLNFLQSKVRTTCGSGRLNDVNPNLFGELNPEVKPPATAGGSDLL